MKKITKEIPADKMSIAKRKPVHGCGINDVDYQTQPMVNGKRAICPYYRVWKDMLQRCYSSNYHTTHPTYIGCVVANEWLVFSVFKQWMIKQAWRGNELDKDILHPGNKHYSSENCVFISSALNKLLNNRKASRGECPQGVDFHKQNGKYRASCRVNGKLKHLGLFFTVDAASTAYKKFKANLITEIANKQSDVRIKNGLFRHANLI